MLESSIKTAVVIIALYLLYREFVGDNLGIWLFVLVVLALGTLAAVVVELPQGGDSSGSGARQQRF